MTDGPRSAYGLAARIERLERELARIASEVAEVRVLAARVTPQVPVPVEPTPTEQPIVVGPRPQFPPASPAASSPAAPPPEAPPPATPPAAPPPFRLAPPPPAPPPAPPRPPGRTLGELARDWDLVGPRGFAIAGGVVTAFGIGLFFVLAANRGWIDERARVGLGTAASTLVFAAGLLLRARYGQYWSALAAVGAGIAGAYATLAAAAARYDLVPDALALPLAGVIAAVGTAVAVRWRSQVIAAIGLVGAALAPALQALDTALTWESAAFAVIVLVAAGAVSVPRAWVELLLAISAIVVFQVEWLVVEAASPPEPGAVAVASALCLVLLGISVGRQLTRSHAELDQLALGYAIAAFALVLAVSLQLFADDDGRGSTLLAAAAVWGLVFAALHLARLPDLALAVGVSALALGAVGTAYLLVGATLTVVWAAQSIVLTAVAWRIGDARLRATAIAYAVLATGHVLLTDGELRFLFDEQADQLGGVLPLASAALAAGAAGLLVPERYVPRTENGLLAFVRELRFGLSRHPAGLAETLCFAAAALATLAGSFALVAASWEDGHVTASFLAAVIGALTLGVAGLRRSPGLVVASYVWLGAVLVNAFIDADRFYDEVSELSSGGWSVIGAASGLLAGAYVHRVVDPDRRAADVLLGIVSGIVALSVLSGTALVTDTQRAFGVGLLLVAVAYGTLAAGVFAREDLRNASTILSSFGLVFLVGAEAALVTSDVWRTVVVALTGLAVGSLALPLREMRLWLAGGSLLSVTATAGLLVQVQPWLGEGEIERRLALVTVALAVSAFGLAGLVWRQPPWRDLVTALWSIGIPSVVVTERVLLDDWRWTAVAAALTALVVGWLARPLREMRLWLAGGALAVVASALALLVQVQPWVEEGALEQSLGLVTIALAISTFGLAALVWREARWRDLSTILWSVGVLAVLSTERVLLDDWRRTAFVIALTGAVLALAARRLGDARIWFAGGVVVGVATLATLVTWTPPDHLFRASSSPAGGVWVLAACILALGVLAATAPDAETRVLLGVPAGSFALYAASLGILEVGVRLSASSEAGFERAHTAVSVLWALVGLALLVLGLLRGSAAIRYAGLALFGLSLAKIFLFDLAELSSVARAFSFILVGALLLAGGFFLQRLSDRIGPGRGTPST